MTSINLGKAYPDGTVLFRQGESGNNMYVILEGKVEIYLEKSDHEVALSLRSQGDFLVVGVNSDGSVRQIKGGLRPIIQQAERCELVAALHCVDYVCLFETPDPLPLIKLLKPNILVKGADWPLERTIGAEEVQKAGGKVVHVELVPDSSTTKIIERILDRFQ